MKYRISFIDAEKHFIDFELEIEFENKRTITLQLPSWRPGRYELANFAKNIKDFHVLDKNNQSLSFTKLNKDSWKINTENTNKVTVKYSYYAAELNAGSTFLNEDQLYINPVNCMMYLVDNSEQEYELNFTIDNNYKIFTSLEKTTNNTFRAKNFDELADSPILASDTIKYKMKRISEVDFHFCFQGEIKVEWNIILNDFEKFIEYQIKIFGIFPHSEFYFLFQITPYKSYHGVEHHKSTVILLGPSYDVFKKLYSEFLGISSHELYHVWNVKSIRPKEMHPYDFSKENYSQMGYVAEGVTTYMGDRMLFESGVFSKEDYFKELKTLLIRHFHNDGRNHYSVAESSWDTWLDGYTVGVPGRKVSIYVEGALIAMICDSKVREQTDFKKSLHDVIKKLFKGFGSESSYNHKIYKSALEDVSGYDFSSIFEDFIFGKQDFTKHLKNAFNIFSWDFKEIKSENITWQYGFKCILRNEKFVVSSVLENSASYISGLAKDDVILAINNFKVDNNLKQWMNYFYNDSKVFAIERNQKLIELELKSLNDFQYYEYIVKDK